MSYVLTARRPNGEVLFYHNDSIQGERMVIASISYCRRFPSVYAARKDLARLRENWKGLSRWKVCKVND